MDFDISVHDASTILPLGREELFSDIIQRKTQGHLSAIWHYPGHIFVTTNEGHRLFTFDCKPVTQQHAFASDCLDLPSLSSPVIAVFMESDNVAIIVCRSGHVFVYQKEASAAWTRLTEFELCSSSKGSQIVSITHIPQLRSLVWCEKQLTPDPTPTPGHTQEATFPASPISYAICWKKLPSDYGNLAKTSDSEVVIFNCPPLDVHALAGDLVFLSSRYDKDQVTVHVIYNCKNSALTLYIGGECVNKPLSSWFSPTDFQELALTALPAFVKGPAGLGDLGVRHDQTTRQTAVLSSSGHCELFSCSKDTQDPEKLKVTRSVVDLSTALDHVTLIEKRHWLLCRGCLGLLYKDKIHFVRLSDGSLHCAHSGMSPVQDVINNHSPAFLGGVLTSSGLILLQNSGKKNVKEEGGQTSLPQDQLLQTDILRLAQLHQQKLTMYDSKVIQEVSKLKERLDSGQTSHNYSQLSLTVSPYLEEYWKLEALSQTVLDVKKSSTPIESPDVSDASTLINNLLAKDGYSRTSRHSKLVWLSQVHPQALLDHLCQDISIGEERLIEDELSQWQALLGHGGGDLTSFEFICRLLFVLHPEKLVNFVQCAECASEHSVGVSAFVRKNKSLMYYKAANECLPDTMSSSDPTAAASAKAKLILASECEGSVEQALKLLLGHRLWAQAISLLREQRKNKDMLPTYLFIAVTTMCQSHVLPDYVVDLLSIMDSWKSFVSLIDVASKSSEIRQEQLSVSASQVFAQSSTGVPFCLARPFIINLLNKKDAIS